MVNKLLNIDLPVELLEIIDKEFKLIRESDTKLLNILRNYILEHGFYRMYIALLIVMAANISLILLKL